jgi:hypothetical protein
MVFSPSVPPWRDRYCSVLFKGIVTDGRETLRSATADFQFRREGNSYGNARKALSEFNESSDECQVRKTCLARLSERSAGFSPARRRRLSAACLAPDTLRLLPTKESASAQGDGAALDRTKVTLGKKSRESVNDDVKK